MTESGFDIIKEIPSREVVDLSVLPRPFSKKDRFSRAVMAMGCSKSLPKFFPNIPDTHNQLSRPNVVMNDEYRESLITLPPELYDSRTYEKNPTLRGPLEEIILANENERIRSGFSRNCIFGDGWSKHFKVRFEKLTPRIGHTELGEISNLEEKKKLPENLRGTKIA